MSECPVHLRAAVATRPDCSLWGFVGAVSCSPRPAQNDERLEGDGRAATGRDSASSVAAYAGGGNDGLFSTGAVSTHHCQRECSVGVAEGTVSRGFLKAHMRLAGRVPTASS